MSDTKHAPEPWEAVPGRRFNEQDNGWIVVDGNGDSITGWGSVETTEDITKRIAACVNACEGIEDPEGTITALREALDAMVIMADAGPKPRKLDEGMTWRANDEKARSMADAALAKAEQG